MSPDIALSLSKGTLTKSQLKKLTRRGQISQQERQELELQLQTSEKGAWRLRDIRPKTINQNKIFKLYNAGKNLMLHGLPGTGKTFISMYLALNEVLNAKTYDKVVIVRSVVPTRDMGFLPGSEKEKIAVYEAPYVAICTELFGKPESYESLKKAHKLDFIPTSFIRGLTIDNAIVIVDECQNLNGHELDSIITRLGDTSKIIFSGDFRQSDFRFADERQGLVDFIDVLDNMECFAHVEMEENDIVRGATVKEYIITKARLGKL